MKCKTTSWEAEQGAEFRSDVFIWVLGRWVRVYNLDRPVACEQAPITTTASKARAGPEWH